MKLRKLSDAEGCTILRALRDWQANGCVSGVCDGDCLTDDDAIEALCQEVNLCDIYIEVSE